MLNSLQTSPSFAIMFPVTSTSSGTRKAQKIGIGKTNFAAVAMEIKKGGFNFFFYFFHQTSWNIVGIFTVVCGSFWHVDGVGWCPLFFFNGNSSYYYYYVYMSFFFLKYIIYFRFCNIGVWPEVTLQKELKSRQLSIFQWNYRCKFNSVIVWWMIWCPI